MYFWPVWQGQFMKFWQGLDQLINYQELLASKFMNCCDQGQRPAHKQD
jgi:hypothetical protein